MTSRADNFCPKGRDKRGERTLFSCQPPPSPHSKDPVPGTVQTTEPSHLQSAGSLGTLGQASPFAVLRFPSYHNENKQTKPVSSSPRWSHLPLHPPVCPPRSSVHLAHVSPRDNFFPTIKTLLAFLPSIIGSLSFILDTRLCLFCHVTNSHPAPLSRGALSTRLYLSPAPTPRH